VSKGVHDEVDVEEARFVFRAVGRCQVQEMSEVLMHGRTWYEVQACALRRWS